MIKIVGKADFIDNSDAKIISLDNDSDLMMCILNHIINPTKQDLIMLSDNLNRDVRLFENQFKIVEAAGGWVFTPRNDLLMIYRGGFWDIPKGHLEKGEEVLHCAIREVEEETGASKLQAQDLLGQSNHLYLENGNYSIKRTYWFRMQTQDKQALKPQNTEGITKAIWVREEMVESYLNNSWRSIKDFYWDYLKS